MGETKTLNRHEDERTVTKSYVTPEENRTRTTSVSAPDAATMAQLQEHVITPLQKAYGINPETGEVTPFQALGYKPEDERKRREAEMALNDRKRKENAWYNAFAVLGDSITAALGGNVWQRQPNKIGQQAIADNQRLIAEQKAEDMNNAAILRNAGVKYAEDVNRLIQNYLTKTTTESKPERTRTETITYPARDISREVLDVSGNKGRSDSKNNTAYININTTGADGVVAKNRYDVTPQQYKALKGILKEHYNKILSANNEQSEILRDRLTNSHVLKGVDSNGQYLYDEDQLLLNGHFWLLDDATRDRIEKELNGKVKFRRNNATSQSSSSTQTVAGRLRKKNSRSAR